MADPRPFMEIAAGFPADLPDEQYNAVRQKYFNDVVIPRLGRGSSMSAAWDLFMKNTQRPKAMKGLDRMTLPLSQAASGFGASFMRPVAALLPRDPDVKRASQWFEKREQVYSELAHRAGASHIPTAVGEFAGALPAFALAEETAGASLEGILPAEFAARVPMAYGALKGGTALASLDAIEAKDGNRFTAGARGFAWGAGLGIAGPLAWKGVGSLTTELTSRRLATAEEVEEIVRKHVSGEPVPTRSIPLGPGPGQMGPGSGLPQPLGYGYSSYIAPRGVDPGRQLPPASIDEIGIASRDQIIQGDFEESAQASNHVEGRPRDIRQASESEIQLFGGSVTQRAKLRGGGVVITGKTAVTGEAQPWNVRVQPGAEKDALDQVLDYARKGGVVENILYHPDALSTLRKYMQLSSEAVLERYSGARIIHAPGDAAGVAAEMRINGDAAIHVDPDRVLVQDPVRSPPTESETDETVRQMRMPDLENPGADRELTKAERLAATQHIKAIWNSAIPDDVKEEHAQQLSRWDLGDMIPGKWRRPRVVPEMTDIPAGETEIQKAEPEVREETETPESRVQTKTPLNRYEQFKPLMKLPEEREFLESAPPELQQGMRAEQYGEHAPWGGLHIPDSERYTLERDPEGGVRRVTYPTGEVLERGPLYSTLRLGTESGGERLFREAFRPPLRSAVREQERTLRRLVLGKVTGTVGEAGELKQFMQALGLEIPSEFGLEQPTILLGPDATAMTETHEAMHLYDHLVPALRQHMESGGKAFEEIGDGLKKRSRLYAGMSRPMLNEEAFVHAATAIIHGDAEALAELVRMDGDIDEVMGRVGTRAKTIHDALRWDGSDAAPERIIQRQMEDLMRRTTSKEEGDLAWELANATEDELSDFRYDPERRKWIETSTGRERLFSARKDMLDAIAKESAAKDWAPSHTGWAERRGARGPIAPRGAGPIKNPPKVDQPPEPPEVKWSLFTAIDQWVRPMDPMVQDLQQKLNQATKTFGKKLDIYNPFKDVADAARDKGKWMEPFYEQLDGALKGAGKKQWAYLDLLAEDPKHWEEMASQYKLSPEDLPKLRQLNELINKLDADDPEMKIRDFLVRDWKNLRSSGRSVGDFFEFGTREELSPIEQMIKKGDLDTTARHAGSFLHNMIKEIGERKFTREPLVKFEKLINSRAKNGQLLLGDLQKPLQRYVDYMRMVPDDSARAINKTMDAFLDLVTKTFEKANQYLPSYAQLPTDLGLSQDWINRMVALSYASGIGLRAVVPIRDALFTFITAMPVLGPQRFARGMARGLTREGWQFANDEAALLGHRTIGETYGDIINEIPRGGRMDKLIQFANKLMAPSRWGHNLGRSVVFNGEYGDALDAVGRYRRGEITFDELKHSSNTSLWWTDKPFQERIQSQLEDRTGFSDHEVARNMAHEILDLTQWPYRRGMQPTYLQTGAGRLFGQYGLWPSNYIEFMRRGAAKMREPGARAAGFRAAAMWGGINYAASTAMAGMGIDASRMLWQSPGGIGLGPTGQFVLDLGQSLKETPDGREARRRVGEYASGWQFLPTSVEMGNIWDAIETGAPLFDNDGHPTAEAVKLLGFTPLKDVKQRDIEDRILFGMGYTRDKSGTLRPTLVERERPAP